METILEWFNQAVFSLVAMVRMPYDLADALSMMSQGLSSMQVVALMLLIAMLVLTMVRSLMGMSQVSVAGAFLRTMVAIVLIGVPSNGAFTGMEGIWYSIVVWAGWTINPHIGPVVMSSMMGCALLVCFIAGMLGFACLPGAGSSKHRFRKADTASQPAQGPNRM